MSFKSWLLSIGAPNYAGEIPNANPPASVGPPLGPGAALYDLREPRALPGWLATTARNESLQVIRHRGRVTPADPQWAPWERPDRRPELDNDLIREERAIALREAMLELAPQGRELLRLLMVDPPMSYDQISVLLGIPKGSIGPTRARILDKLRTHRALQDLASPC